MNTDALKHWVTESTRGAKLSGNNSGNTIESRVQRLINSQEPIKDTRVLYRIHSPNSQTINPKSWFATSSDINKVIRQHLSKNADCCLFKINVVPGIKILDVDKTLKNAGIKPTGYDESEVIVDGKGIFTHPSSETGFFEVGNTKGIRTFETFYGPKPLYQKKSLTAKNVFDKFIPNEFFLINSKENAMNIYKAAHKNNNVNNNTFEEVWKLIQIEKEKESKGGKRTRRKLRRNKTVKIHK